MQLLANANRWAVFAVVAIATSWLLRLLAVSAARMGARRLGDARVALGLTREIPREFAFPVREKHSRSGARTKALEPDDADG